MAPSLVRFLSLLSSFLGNLEFCPLLSEEDRLLFSAWVFDMLHHVNRKASLGKSYTSKYFFHWLSSFKGQNPSRLYLLFFILQPSNSCVCVRVYLCIFCLEFIMIFIAGFILYKLSYNYRNWIFSFYFFLEYLFI